LRVFDASSLIHAWDNYPESQFPALWEWIARQFASDYFVLPSIAYDEISHKAPDCVLWLRARAVTPITVDNLILQEALRIMALLRIVDGKYGRGVDENDILIIATAKVKGMHLVSEEARQSSAPLSPANMKIPAVCALPAVTVSCLNFVELFRESGVIFR